MVMDGTERCAMVPYVRHNAGAGSEGCCKIVLEGVGYVVILNCVAWYG